MKTVLHRGESYRKRTHTSEREFEEIIAANAGHIFGPNRIYLDIKKKIGKKGKKNNIPDGYLLDLRSTQQPQLYVVENELASHELKHIAMQLLEFSMSFEDSRHAVKKIIYDALGESAAGMMECERYARDNGYRNVDFLLEKMIFEGQFRALVIIDDTVEELYSLLKRQFQFPIEIIELYTYEGGGERLYAFDPFRSDVEESVTIRTAESPGVDIAEVDTIVVPARDEGFQDVFLGKNCWYSIRISESMIPQIKHIATYRIRPISAITHLAPVSKIEPYGDDSGKMIVYFSEPAREIKPIPLVKRGKIKAPQSLRYTTYELLMKAKNLDEVFP